MKRRFFQWFLIGNFVASAMILLGQPLLAQTHSLAFSPLWGSEGVSPIVLVQTGEGITSKKDLKK